MDSVPISKLIELFFTSSSFGVVGASNDRKKYGNIIFRKYKEKGLTAYAVNPHESRVEDSAAFKNVKDLPADTKSLSIVTPPEVTEKIVRDAVQKGIKTVWMQPGAESDEAVAYAEAHGVHVIADGSCVLLKLGERFL
jgi:predicted CoA-binding protein